MGHTHFIVTEGDGDQICSNFCDVIYNQPLIQSNFFQNFRCRVYEMDGHVVARGIVPSILCTPQAFAQINLNIAHLVRCQ